MDFFRCLFVCVCVEVSIDTVGGRKVGGGWTKEEKSRQLARLLTVLNCTNANAVDESCHLLFDTNKGYPAPEST